MKIKQVLPYAFMALFTFTACHKKEDDGSAKIKVSLTDAPGDYAAVNVDVIGVEINRQITEAESGWEALTLIKPGVINLLDLSNGRQLLLASADLPAGTISQIRLKLGNKNSLVLKDGRTVALNTPSGQSSGLKLQINQELKADVTYEILLDFDAAKSIVPRGNTGLYNLKPVIRTNTLAIKGGIRGKVTPAEAKPGILVLTAANDTVAGGFTDAATGDFIIKGISAGTYQVEFTAPAPYKTKEIKSVTVTNDNISEMGTINLNK
jgi:hypothetical protein